MTQPDAEGRALFVRDENGDTFAIPAEVAEQHRISAEQYAAFEEQLGSDDVSGYANTDMAGPVPSWGSMLSPVAPPVPRPRPGSPGYR